MAVSYNEELEAAKFLQKLIQECPNVPAKLATKLYFILQALQHMKASGKENSTPFKVVSKAMETVINQHGLDIEALTSSRHPPSTGLQRESSTSHAQVLRLEEMAASYNEELEAAKFLQKLIQECPNVPAKLATKLYFILQHMKASGKENSTSFKVIFKYMETVGYQPTWP